MTVAEPTDRDIESLADEVESRLTDLGIDRAGLTADQQTNNLFFALLTVVARQLHRTYAIRGNRDWDHDDAGEYISNVISYYDGDKTA